MSKPYQVGDIVEVRVGKIVPKGFGLAFAQNLTVFVSLAAPGDVLRVRITEMKGSTAFAEIEEVIEASPERIQPPCPYFGACGGCDFQQLKYRSQLDAKVGIIRDCLHRIGKIDHAEHIEIVPSPREFDYRLRAQWHVDPQTRKIGYFRRASHEVIDVEHCPIVTPELEHALEDLRRNVDWSIIGSNRIQAEAAHGSDGTLSMYSEGLPVATAEVVFEARDFEYAFSAKSFFQGNKYLVEPLVNAAVGGLSGDTALDLFCGVGLFTLPLAKSFTSVKGVESNATAIEFAKKNAARAGLKNAEFVTEGVESFVQRADIREPDLVVFDPPRSGTSKETIRKVIELRPKVISYVSCEPSILARDLRWMLDGGYSIATIVAIDLFPQTHHVETVASLQRL